MNSNRHLGYIRRKDTFSSDRKHCENPKGCHQIYFALSDIERLHLLALNLTEFDMSYINKSNECPPCVIERRFGLRLDYDKNRIDNFSEATSEHICGGCSETFKVKNIGNLINDLQARKIAPIEKINRVFALMHEDKGKGRCEACAVEQIEKESHQCAMCKTDLSKHRSLHQDQLPGNIYILIHKQIDALCFHCAAYKIEKDQRG